MPPGARHPGSSPPESASLPSSRDRGPPSGGASPASLAASASHPWRGRSSLGARPGSAYDRPALPAGRAREPPGTRRRPPVLAGRTLAPERLWRRLAVTAIPGLRPQGALPLTRPYPSEVGGGRSGGLEHRPRPRRRGPEPSLGVGCRSRRPSRCGAPAGRGHPTSGSPRPAPPLRWPGRPAADGGDLQGWAGMPSSTTPRGPHDRISPFLARSGGPAGRHPRGEAEGTGCNPGGVLVAHRSPPHQPHVTSGGADAGRRAIEASRRQAAPGGRGARSGLGIPAHRQVGRVRGRAGRPSWP